MRSYLILSCFSLCPCLSVSVPHYITQRVPIPCQQRACAVKLLSDYLLSLFSHYLFSFIPRTITYSMASNVSSPKGFHILTYFISVSLIVFPDCALLFEGFTPYYTQSVGKRTPLYLNSLAVPESSACVPIPSRLVCYRPFFTSTPLPIIVIAVVHVLLGITPTHSSRYPSYRIRDIT